MTKIWYIIFFCRWLLKIMDFAILQIFPFFHNLKIQSHYGMFIVAIYSIIITTSSAAYITILCLHMADWYQTDVDWKCPTSTPSATSKLTLNTLRPRQNGCHFTDKVCKCIFLNENVWILLTISLKFVPKCPINNIPSLVQIMAWRRPGDKSLSEPMMVSLLTHIWVPWPQWVKGIWSLIIASWAALPSNGRQTDVELM